MSGKVDRDPRVTPMPGDEVEFGPQWQRERYYVLGLRSKPDRVQYQMAPHMAVFECTLDEWRKWNKTSAAEVIRRGEDSRK